MNEDEEKKRWIILFIIVAILSLIGVSVLTFILQKVLTQKTSVPKKPLDSIAFIDFN
jgi:flagellar basal body-associated protein FliL